MGCEHERAGKTEMSFVFSRQMRSALTYLSQCIQNLDVSTKIEYILQEYTSIFLTVITNHKCDPDLSRVMSHSRNVTVFVHSQAIIVWKHSNPWSWKRNSSRYQTTCTFVYIRFDISVKLNVKVHLTRGYIAYTVALSR